MMGFVLLVVTSTFTNVIFLLWCRCMSCSMVQGSINGTEDQLALLAFKARITHDPFQVLSSWNDSLPYCKWHGIICGHRHLNKVRALHLSSNGFEGTMAPEIGNLSFLQEISLENNSFHGIIPIEVSFLLRLRYLFLHNNSFEGEIPPNISSCSNLIELWLSNNNIVGKIPAQLGSLSKLQILKIYKNNLTGQIPISLGNLSSLETLSGSYNDFSGSIPDSLGQRTRLSFLSLGNNKLFGTVPPSLYNHSSLNILHVQYNQLLGSLPPNIGFSLPNLRWFSIGGNHFHGSIPSSVSNLSKLEFFWTGINNLTGKVDIHFEGLSKLSVVSLDNNHLGSGETDDLSFVNTLTNCSGLEELWLGYNQFGGVLPNSIGNLSIQLKKLQLSGNQISGDIPVGIGNLLNLQHLGLLDNLLEGSIPSSIGRLQMLHRLYLYENGFTGSIPSSFGNLTELNDLFLDDNHLHGNIPSSLGKCKNLLYLCLSKNSLNGIIPKEIFDLSMLVELNLSRNDLLGFLPSEVGQLNTLEILDVSKNMLSGEIPHELGACTSLQLLFLEDNFFEGSITLSMSSLRGLQDVDLSHNNFSDSIPKYMGTFMSLQHLNLSFNLFEGEVPTKGVFGNLSAISIVGNNNLCGGIPELHLPACRNQESKQNGRLHVVKLIVIICGCGASLCLIFIICFFFIHRRRKQKKESMAHFIDDLYFKISYAQLLKATNGFSSENLIGVGNFGSVYKGVLNDSETTVAVKVLNIEHQGASKSFMAECEAFRNIRHRNLVKILTSCSSVDFEGNDFMALVYEFMPHGNLEEWLHPHANGIQHEQRHLDFVQRVNIAIDIATALDHLHNYCHVQIIHCDLKPSNILLDADLTAHLGDFGISRILSKATCISQNQISSIGLKGSVGYIPPEYGASADISTYGDIYSYGILLLEMFTKKRPTDEMFKDNLNLHHWAEIALHDGVMAIVDQSVFTMENDEQESEMTTANINGSQRCVRDRVQKCLYLVIKIGVSCSAKSPRDRMAITNVVKELHSIKNIYLCNS